MDARTETYAPVMLGAVAGTGDTELEALTGSCPGSDFCDADTDYAKSTVVVCAIGPEGAPTADEE